MALTTFDPATNGLHFPNNFINQVLGGLITTRGRGGGMAYAALDYYFAGLPVPTHRSGDFGPGAAVPPDGSALADYIYDRLIDSFLANVGHWANVALNPFFNPVDFTRAHIPAILGDIDLGRPVPLGLIATRNPLEIGSNHQVVAYGYEVNAAASSLTLFIYDNNAPDVPVTLTTNPNNPVSITYSTGQRWIGFFKEEYSTKRPPYLDLGLADGLDLTLTGESKTLTLPLHLRISPVSSNMSVTLQFQDVGAPLTAAYTVKNFGAFPAHLEKFSLPVTGPAGTDEAVLGSVVCTTMQPGEQVVVSKTAPSFATIPGPYTMRAQYTNARGKAIDVPEVTSGTHHQARITVVPAGTRLQSVPLARTA